MGYSTKDVYSLINFLLITLYLNVSYIASFHFSNTFDIGHKEKKQYNSSINFFFQVVDVIRKVISCWDSLKQCAPPTRAIAANCSVMGFTPEKQFQLIAVGNKLEINPNNFQSSVCNMQSRIVCHCRNTKKFQVQNITLSLPRLES